MRFGVYSVFTQEGFHSVVLLSVLKVYNTSYIAINIAMAGENIPVT